MPTKRSAAPKMATPRSAKKKGALDLAAFLATAQLPAHAAGLGRAKGLGVNANVDAFLGLGFPYLIVPTDAEIGSFATCRDFAKAFAHDANVMPRLAVAQQYAIEVPATPNTLHTTPASPVPPSRPVQAAKDVKRALAYHNGRTIQQLEVMLGSLAVAEEIVKQLAAMPGARWADRGVAPVISAGLRWILWRIPAADRERLRASLERTFDAVEPGSRGARALDVLLHGRAGVERSGSNFNGALHLYDLVSADDDPQWASDTALRILGSLRPADREGFDPQLVVLCGEKVLAAFRKSTDRFPSADRKRIGELLALFR